MPGIAHNALHNLIPLILPNIPWGRLLLFLIYSEENQDTERLRTCPRSCNSWVGESWHSHLGSQALERERKMCSLWQTPICHQVNQKMALMLPLHCLVLCQTSLVDHSTLAYRSQMRPWNPSQPRAPPLTSSNQCLSMRDESPFVILQMPINS